MLTGKLAFPTAFPDRFVIFAVLDTDLRTVSLLNPNCCLP